MKEKVILSYSKGITHSPSDLLCSDGELEECVNLEVKDGELVPMEMPVELPFYVEKDERLVLVHDLKTQGKNYFVVSGGVLKCFKVVDSSRIPFSLEVECGEVKSIRAIGNTVIAYTKNSPHYILFFDGVYKYLGSTMPELDLSFNLDGDLVFSETFDVSLEENSNGLTSPDLSTDEKVEIATNQIIPQVNKFIAKESEEKGLFIYPFLVRYAYRLFDGSYVMQSSPVLMMPSTTIAPICGYARLREGVYKSFVSAVVSNLTVSKVDANFRFGDWSDIISSVSIFVSSPFRTYDQEGEVKSWASPTVSSESPSFNSYFYGTSSSIGLNNKFLISGLVSDDANFPLDTSYNTFNVWDLPQKDTGDVISEIAGCSLFYKYASYSPDYIDNNIRWVIKSEDVGINPVSGIELNETLPDDYMTHDKFVPESSFVYNGRLNVSNVERFLFKGYPAKSLSWGSEDANNTLGYYNVYTYIKTLDGSIIVKSPMSNAYSISGHYLFYPDTDAYRMVIHDPYNNQYATIPLSEHSGLNGAYYFNGFTDIQFQSGNPGVSETALQSEHLPNKLFTSEVNNPFRFPLAGINTVGSGEIIGISAVTRPISQGQFGEYPLIAFCSDGNYALKVDSEGFYSGISPIQEDLVLHGDQITPMENSVAIITKRGIMLTSGGEMRRIASQMDGGVMDISPLDGIKTRDIEFTSIIDNCSDDEGFLSYLNGSRMAFDYSSDRLLIYNTEKKYSYMYNFSNDTVSKMMVKGGMRIVASVSDYPDTIIQDELGKLYSLYNKKDVSSESERLYGVVFTRPLKMGEAMTMKAVRQINSVASHGKGDSFVKYMIYGSNDNVTYYRMGSRFGKPYKYYRLAIYTKLMPKESLSGTVMTIENRRNHKLR